MKLSKNWKDWVLTPYYLVLVIFVLLPLGSVTFLGVGLRWLGTEIERLANFNTKYDLFWLERLKKWKDG